MRKKIQKHQDARGNQRPQPVGSPALYNSALLAARGWQWGHNEPECLASVSQEGTALSMGFHGSAWSATEEGSGTTVSLSVQLSKPRVHSLVNRQE